MTAVRVSLGDRSYDIRFGPLGRDFASALARLNLAGRRALVVTTRGVARAGQVRAVITALKAARVTSRVVEIADGEHHKSLRTVERLYREGFRFGLDRKSAIVGVGGGVITDMAGFAASTYMRGVPYISVPTTMLAMVDAAVGGKTGVDTPEGKNLVGTFWQPRLVWINPGMLSSLPDRQWRTGFAEAAKYGVILDARFFSWLEARVAAEPRLSRWSAADVLKMIRRSVELKARTVSADEIERPLGGGREILNFGHTAGHALEAATGYRTVTHGEAISIGMLVAGNIALSRGNWSEKEQARLSALLHAAGLPVRFPRLSARQKAVFWDALRRDKKNVDARLRFVLPVRMGRVTVQSGIAPAEVREAARLRGF